MLLTISTTYQPATDLGYLVYKNPARRQSFELSFGEAHIFYPEASEDRCTLALLLNVDPVGLVRRGQSTGGDAGWLTQYVNDRPYVASSFLSVAIAEVLGSALRGQSKERPDLAASAIPLELTIAAIPCRGGEPVLRRLFEPLGYQVLVTPHSLDTTQPTWGLSRYFTVTLTAVKRLADVLTHLYVLIPVLDDEKHYWVGDDEVKKLVRHGEGWLAAHPERDLITTRYLKHRKSLVRDAISRLVVEEMPGPENIDAPGADGGEKDLEQPLSLNQQRLATVMSALRASGAKSVVDLGCGEGRLLTLLLDDHSFDRIVGVDVSHRSLEIAADRLHLDQIPPKARERIHLWHGSLVYRDQRLNGFDAAAVVEVIEHLDPPRLAAFERAIFEFARPGTVVLTTPNAEYNTHWASLPAGRFRHPDHRFEWTRRQFEDWSAQVATRHGYVARFLPVGTLDPAIGSPTQMAIFTLGR